MFDKIGPLVGIGASATACAAPRQPQACERYARARAQSLKRVAPG
jgi:hypothetical protein